LVDFWRFLRFISGVFWISLQLNQSEC